MVINIVTEPRVYLVGRPSLVINQSGKATKDLVDFMEDEEVYFSLEGLRREGNPSWEKQWPTDTSNPAELLCMVAGKICYDAYGKGRSEIGPYLENIIESKHGSVLEHVSWNFIIAGVSRVFSHEHVRHRAGVAISQRSQRYVNESEGGQVILPMIENNAEAKSLWEDAILLSQQTYEKLVEILADDLRDQVDSTVLVKTVRSAARSVMPNCTETYIFWTANARALRHYIEMRASRFADIEIRRVALQILEIMQVEAPNIFGDYTVNDYGQGLLEATTPNVKV